VTQSTAVSTDTRAPAPAAPKAPKPTVRVGGTIAALAPQTVEEVFRLAEGLAQGGDMVPKAFQGEPMKIMAAITKGMEVGLAPMQALASIAVVNGRAVLWGDALPALMQRAGHHVDVEYEGDGERLTAVATLTRGDTGKVIVRRFSLADAKRAGLLGKQGPWSQYPSRMLAMRARSYAIRDGAADALMGLSIGEEVSDYGPDRARDVTPEAPAPRKGGVAYRDLAPPVDEVVEGEVVAPDAEDEEARAQAEVADGARQSDAALTEGGA
jgi:hypothetical protein